MPPRRPFAKIAITLPQEDLAAADRLALEHDRSRSWIIAESVRQYVARADAKTADIPLDPSRAEQLRRDLTLTPLDRVLASEESVQAIGRTPGDPAASAPLIFDDFDAFLAWSHARTSAS